MMKIIPKPISVDDEVDKSRDMSGLNKWARSSRTVGFLLFLLGWFTIPVEVLLRKDFGQRWFTVVNFYAGLFLLVLFAGIQWLINAIWDHVLNFLESILDSIMGSEHIIDSEPPAFSDQLLERSMLITLAAYVLLSSYHLFKIWWRNRTDTALHSFDDGTSRLEPLAGYLMQAINALAIPFVYFYSFLLPPKQRSGVTVPKLINDRSAFANTVIEPLMLLVLAIELHGITSFWLYLSAVALAIHANWRETAKLNKVLDFRDSIIDAKAMMQLRNPAEQPAAEQVIIRQAAATLRNNPDMAPQLSEQYPDLMSIIEAVNQDSKPSAN